MVENIEMKVYSVRGIKKTEAYNLFTSIDGVSDSGGIATGYFNRALVTFNLELSPPISICGRRNEIIKAKSDVEEALGCRLNERKGRTLSIRS